MAWRHYGCITAKQFENLKNDFEEADDVDGFEDLTPDDQEKFRKAFQQGHGQLLLAALHPSRKLVSWPSQN